MTGQRRLYSVQDQVGEMRELYEAREAIETEDLTHTSQAAGHAGLKGHNNTSVRG